MSFKKAKTYRKRMDAIRAGDVVWAFGWCRVVGLHDRRRNRAGEFVTWSVIDLQTGESTRIGGQDRSMCTVLR